MSKEVEYKNDRIRWQEYTRLSPEKVKDLIEEKVKRAILLSESTKQSVQRLKT